MRLKHVTLGLTALMISIGAAAPALADVAGVGEALASPVTGMTKGMDAGVAWGEENGVGPFVIVTALVGGAVGLFTGTVKGAVTVIPEVVSN